MIMIYWVANVRNALISFHDCVSMAFYIHIYEKGFSINCVDLGNEIVLYSKV